MTYPLFLNYLGSISVSSGLDNMLLMYSRSLSYDVSCIESSSVGIYSVMVSLICPACTITVGVSLLFFFCCVSVCTWCICDGIASDFISASFSAIMRDYMPCFTCTTLAHLIDTSCRRLDSCSTISCLNPKALHNLCILIGIQHPSEKCFPPIHKAKSSLKNTSCSPDTAIDSPGPPREYNGCPNIVDALDVMNLSTMDPLVFLQALSTVVANNVSKLSMINASGGFPYQLSL